MHKYDQNACMKKSPIPQCGKVIRKKGTKAEREKKNQKTKTSECDNWLLGILNGHQKHAPVKIEANHKKEKRFE